MSLSLLRTRSFKCVIMVMLVTMQSMQAYDDRWQSFPPHQQALLVGQPLYLRWIYQDPVYTAQQHGKLILTIQPDRQTQETQLLEARLTTAGHTITERLYPKKVQLIIDGTEVIVIIQDVQLSDSGVVKIGISFPGDAVLYDEVVVQVLSGCRWKSPTPVEIHGLVGSNLHLQLVLDDQSCPGPPTELTLYKEDKAILNKQYDGYHGCKVSTSHATVDEMLALGDMLRNVSEEDSGNYQLKATLANNTILEDTFHVTIHTAEALQPSLVMSGEKQHNLSLVTPGYLEIHLPQSVPLLNLTVAVVSGSVSVLRITGGGNQDVTINLAQTAFIEVLITADYGFHENLLILKNAKADDKDNEESHQTAVLIITSCTLIMVVFICSVILKERTAC